ncbi:uncharacterized protein TNCV_976701 [Trichonephila clavipes]|nr:uncharacterized protein TNCV_976701 [Trichonephila clavipes]
MSMMARAAVEVNLEKTGNIRYSVILFKEDFFEALKIEHSYSHPFGIVVSDADCGAVGPGSHPGEGMDVCKCIVPVGHGDTLNSRQAASPLVRLVEGEERWETPDHSRGVLPQNWEAGRLLLFSPSARLSKPLQMTSWAAWDFRGRTFFPLPPCFLCLKIFFCFLGSCPVCLSRKAALKLGSRYTVSFQRQTRCDGLGDVGFIKRPKNLTNEDALAYSGTSQDMGQAQGLHLGRDFILLSTPLQIVPVLVYTGQGREAHRFTSTETGGEMRKVLKFAGKSTRSVLFFNCRGVILINYLEKGHTTHH